MKLFIKTTFIALTGLSQVSQIPAQETLPALADGKAPQNSEQLYNQVKPLSPEPRVAAADRLLSLSSLASSSSGARIP